MRHCCEKFSGYYEDNSETDGGEVILERYPSIKIVKAPYDNENPYRYLFVLGLLRDRPPIINMAYCPFCGTYLFSFYKEDVYVNGSSDQFF